jgi:hypothetical protein
VARRDVKKLTVRTVAEANGHLTRLRSSAERTRAALRDLLQAEPDALRVLSKLKFEPVGCDPLTPDRPLNVIEQLNQTFTYQASFQAAAWLLEQHPDQGPLVLNLGTSRGHDIESVRGDLVAEVFSAVTPGNNRKLDADIDRLRDSSARFRYVFFLSPTSGGRPDAFEVDGIRVHRLQP